MNTDQHLQRLIEAARHSSGPYIASDEELAAPPGLATRLSNRAWETKPNASIPWLRGLSWGMAACATLALAAHLFVPYQQPVPEMFAPLLARASAPPVTLAMR